MNEDKGHLLCVSESERRPAGRKASYGWTASSDDVRYQFPVIRQMLGDMEAQTVAGQQHTMEKVVAFLRSRIREGSATFTPRNRRELLQMIDQLEKEARRPAPDALLFRDRIHTLIVLLSATT